MSDVVELDQRSCASGTTSEACRASAALVERSAGRISTIVSAVLAVALVASLTAGLHTSGVSP